MSKGLFWYDNRNRWCYETDGFAGVGFDTYNEALKDWLTRTAASVPSSRESPQRGTDVGDGKVIQLDDRRLRKETAKAHPQTHVEDRRKRLQTES